MAVLKNKNGTEMYIDCKCGCDDGIRFKIHKDDFDDYCWWTYTNGNYFSEYGETTWRVFCKKMRKIWAIIRNKDYYYSDIIMTKEEFEEFKEYVNSIE